MFLVKNVENYLILYVGSGVCPACSRKLEDKFMEVKKYVREHPNVDVKELSEEMDVSVRQIRLAGA